MSQMMSNKQILLAALKRKLPLPLILGALGAYILRNLDINLATSLGEEISLSFIFSLISQGLIGIAAITIAAATLFPPDGKDQHPEDPEELKWWTRTNFTELTFLAFFIVVATLVLPLLIGQFMNSSVFITNWTLIAIILLFVAIIWKAVRLVRRLSGYRKENLD